MAHRKTIDLDMAGPGFLKRFNPVRGEHKIEIERAIAELNEILATDN